MLCILKSAPKGDYSTQHMFVTKDATSKLGRIGSVVKRWYVKTLVIRHHSCWWKVIGFLSEVFLACSSQLLMLKTHTVCCAYQVCRNSKWRGSLPHQIWPQIFLFVLTRVSAACWPGCLLRADQGVCCGAVVCLEHFLVWRWAESLSVSALMPFILFLYYYPRQSWSRRSSEH